MLKKRNVRGVFATLLVIGTSGAFGDTLIDNFDNTHHPFAWRFDNGAEFPGAVGSMTLGPGHRGQGARLAFDLSQGGKYVAAYLDLPVPVSAAAIRLWVQSPPNCLLSLRVVDSTGQTLQYQGSRPFEAGTDARAWYQESFLLSAPSVWWDGANDGIVHQPLQTIGILGPDAREIGTVGNIAFDDVSAISSTEMALRPSRTPIPAPLGSSDLLARMGVNIHFTNDDRALDKAQSAGFAWVRMDLFWSAVESSPNIYDWSAYDGLIAALAKRNMKALLILNMGNALYTGGFMNPPTTPEAIRAFARFAEASARHFKGRGARFEICNEPNLPGFWAPDPVQYAAVSSSAIQSVHKGDSLALVSTGGLSGFDSAFLRAYLAQGGADGADAIGVHPYDISSPPQLLTDFLLDFRSIIADRFTVPPPIWDTEWGFTSTDFSSSNPGNGHETAAQNRQATRAVDELLSACAAGFPLFIYYDLRDDGLDPANREHNFGLLSNDYAEKPAFTAVKTLASVARGRKFNGFLHSPVSTVTAMQFNGGSDTVVAVWTHVPGSEISLDVGTSATVKTFTNAPVRVQNGKVTLREEEGPLYVTFPPVSP